MRPFSRKNALHGRLVGRLVVAGERDDDLAVARVLRALHDDDVAVEDAGVDHRLALDAEQEVAAQRLGDREVVLDVLLGEQRPAGRDLPDERQLRRASAARRLAPLAGRRARARAASSGRAAADRRARGSRGVRARSRARRGRRPRRSRAPSAGSRAGRRSRRGSPRSPAVVPVSISASRGRVGRRTCVRQQGRDSSGRRQAVPRNEPTARTPAPRGASSALERT